MENLSAIIQNGKVANIIVGDLTFAKTLGDAVDVTGTNVSIGWGYAQGVFTAPTPPPPSLVPAPENTWWIYVGPFYDRFGAQKLPILASADATVQAIIKDSSVRKYIDLQRAEVAAVCDILVAKGFAINKTAILTTPVAAADRYAG